MKIIFAGTPQFAASALAALLREHQVVAVLTQPDRPAGRGMHLAASPVKQLALQHGLPVLQPATLKGGRDATYARRAGCRRDGGGGLRFDPAESGAATAAPWLPEHPCIAAAALARRGADTARDPGRRHRDRHHHHADGRGAGYRRHAAAQVVPDRGRRHRADPARQTGRDGREQHPRGAAAVAGASPGAGQAG